MADMLTMRQDALRRAREMHTRAQSQRTQQPTSPPNPHINNNDVQNVQPTAEQPVHKNSAETSPLPFNTDVLATFFKDKDKTIILALLILLSGEDGDNTMLLALMYLLI